MENAFIVTRQDTSQAEQLFMPNGELVVPDADLASAIPQEQLSGFCYNHGLYGLITDEIIEEIKAEIGDMTAIEIGSGCGILGKALGIPATDNKEKETEFVKHEHAKMHQPIAPYGDNVEKLEALEAIEKYKPEVVVGCWVTAFVPNTSLSKNKVKRATRRGKKMGISIDVGIKSNLFYKMGVKKFILIGKEGIHGDSLIDNQPYWDVEIVKSDTFVSRTPERGNNAIWIYTRKQ